MQLKEAAIGQAFRFVCYNCDTCIVLSRWHPIFGTEVWNLDHGFHSIISGEGEEEIKCVNFLPIVLESEDLENLDRLIEIEGENEDRASRVTRLLEGAGGAISLELNYHRMFSAND